MAYRVIHLPKAVEKAFALPKHPRHRVQGRINGQAFSGACQPTGQGWYLLISTKRMKQLGLDVGQMLDLELWSADPDEVDIPPALARALASSSEFRQRWERLTPGRQRGLAHRVASAKTEETCERRVFEIKDEVYDLVASGRGCRH